MDDWYPTTVAANLPAAEELIELVLELGGTPLVGGHQAPGQYVRLRLPDQPALGEGIFAIASAPGPQVHRWEFLLKGGSPLADRLMRLTPGERVDSSVPSGRGFPLHQARGKGVLLFATGSGISPIRSVIESIRQERAAFGPVTLYFGARTPRAFAYEDELQHWEAAGIRVVRTVSQPGASDWQGLNGYVQAHLAEQAVEDHVAFVCGQSSMVQGVMDALHARGLPRESIHLNY